MRTNWDRLTHTHTHTHTHTRNCSCMITQCRTQANMARSPKPTVKVRQRFINKCIVGKWGGGGRRINVTFSKRRWKKAAGGRDERGMYKTLFVTQSPMEPSSILVFFLPLLCNILYSNVQRWWSRSQGPEGRGGLRCRPPCVRTWPTIPIDPPPPTHTRTHTHTHTHTPDSHQSVVTQCGYFVFCMCLWRRKGGGPQTITAQATK